MDNFDFDYEYDTLLALGLTSETIDLIVAINGNSLETYDNILFAAFGYHFGQLEEE